MLLGILLLAAFTPHLAHAVKVEQVESSGLKALIIEEKSVPAFTLRISFRRSGNAWVRKDEQGIPYLTSTLMNEGAGALDSTAFQKELDRHAIRFYGSADADSFTLSLESLSDQREKAEELLLLSLTDPRFDEEAITRMRDAILSDLARLEGKPSYVAARAWWQVAFKDHPYGFEIRGTPEALKRITRAQLKQYTREHFAKDNILIAAAGDISADSMKKLLDKLAAALPEKSMHAVEVEKRAPDISAAPVHILREVPQSVVIFGLPGIERKDPRFYTAYVMNYILGGGELSSRLMDELRQRRGLVYSVSTDFSNLEKSAVFSGALASSNETANEAMEAVKSQLTLIGENGVTDKELADAKSFLTGSFPLNMDSNDQLTSYLMAIQIHDLGLDFFDKRNGYIRAVTKEQVNALAKEMFVSKTPLITFAGKADLQAKPKP